MSAKFDYWRPSPQAERAAATRLAECIIRDLQGGEEPGLRIVGADAGVRFLMVAELVHLIGIEYELEVLHVREDEMAVKFSPVEDRRAAA
jgi:hypothetical protein